jgi:hypothetical protein
MAFVMGYVTQPFNYRLSFEPGLMDKTMLIPSGAM